MANELISGAISSTYTVQIDDVAYMDPTASITILATTGSAIQAASSGDGGVSLFLDGRIVGLNDANLINLIGTSSANSVQTGADSLLRTRGTAIFSASIGTEVSLRGDIQAEIAVRSTGKGLTLFNTGTITTTDNSIELSGSSAHIVNAGRIESGRNGMDLSLGSCIIENSGSLSANTIGIDAHGAFNTITNTGTITARDAIRITDDAPTTLSSNEIFNSGTLIGRLNAISVSGGQIRVNNTGLAATTTPSTAAPEAAITLNGTNVQVDNSGTVQAAAGGISATGSIVARIGNSGTVMAETGLKAVSTSGVILRNSGTVEAVFTALVAEGPDLHVVNRGTASGLTGLSALGTADILNTGQLLGTEKGVSVFGSGVLRNSGTILGGTEFGVLLNTASFRIENGGEISGEVGVQAGFGLTGATGALVLRNSGNIAGDTAGLLLSDVTLALWNEGTITGGGLAGIVTDATTRIVNHGMIGAAPGTTAVAEAILTGAGADILRNFGTVSGRVQLGEGADILINRALIEGDVRLGGGDDRYDGRRGLIESTVNGEAGNDVMIGGSDEETLFGGADNDLISGGGGNDRLIGAFGRDTMTGDAGADDFVLNLAGDSPTATPDTITDFVAGTDDFDLRALGAGGSFIGSGAFTSLARQVRYVQATGRLEGDVNGDGLADWAMLITNRPVLTAADFLF